MAQGRYARVDGQNSPNYCLIFCIMGFVSTCLLAAWMTQSSSISPVRTEISVEEFMGGIPKVVDGSDATLPVDALKVNDGRSSVQEGSNPSVQDIGNAFPKESHSTEEQNSQKVKEGLVSGDGAENKGAEKQKRGEDGTDASKQEVTSDKFDGVVQTHNDNAGPKESSDESNKVGETETKVEESGGYQDRIPGAQEEIDAMKKMQDGAINQSDQEINKDLKENSSVLPSKNESTSGTELSNETSPQPQAMPWPTQSAESEKEKLSQGFSVPKQQKEYRWKVCNVTAGPDYIPCLDNVQALKMLHTTGHYEHRERHCPDEAPTCLVPLPKGYRTPVKWPKSRDMIWFTNVPHTRLVDYKGKQNWVKIYDRYLTFPGGGTQFKYGALHYIDYIQQTLPEIAWGKQSRVVLDVGCGVASFGGYLFDRDVLTMSLAPKDEHEAQVQFALERGIPAISAVMGTKRLPYPSMVFDVIHCARCRVPWHIEGGKLLLELNRLLRPGGYFVWSATPVYRKGAEDTSIWKEMSKLTKAMCWELVKVGKDGVNRKSAAIFRKTSSNDCYEERPTNDPPLCDDSDDPNDAWYTPLQQCIHKVAKDSSECGAQWPAPWPSRLEKPPYWLEGSTAGNSPKDFTDDHNHWKHEITNTYMNGIGIDWSLVRNVMDMNASYGGFAAALKDLKLWVMNVVTVNSSDTLPIIYERGLFGIYHDWCESFSTYPRSYDLLHADHLFSDLAKRCNIVSVMAEVDRILRPGGRLIVRDNTETMSEVRSMAKSLHWKITHYNDNDELVCIMKTLWRPSEVELIAGATA
ncbi:probable methyltransferase PMT24 [Chenopodium quinoa]|uniref:probable methyltransferase PMT24 n=1 Tax=Chenopodium quinoa TaxID=63459 RepID=UPI000B7988D7|nr:probable methyltransferase PMT24 [Chenopodium quinoa]XP_021760920.1 probable methyltransferase PMT24 [Chenopodium quinoa]XP_021760921.1 probable methyltransferase PMT24 [Chenopodium quinoa]XP_021760922.1 probable methyltransferase PMT24 [Chenopodium quinoa]